MIQYHETIPEDDQRFLLGYCRDRVHRAHGDRDLEAAIFWSNMYVDFLQELRHRGQIPRQMDRAACGVFYS